MRRVFCCISIYFAAPSKNCVKIVKRKTDDWRLWLGRGWGEHPPSVLPSCGESSKWYKWCKFRHGTMEWPQWLVSLLSRMISWCQHRPIRGKGHETLTNQRPGLWSPPETSELSITLYKHTMILRVYFRPALSSQWSSLLDWKMQTKYLKCFWK